jgi:hypothetical protein
LSSGRRHVHGSNLELFENGSVFSIEEYDEPYYINDQWVDIATRADPGCGR